MPHLAPLLLAQAPDPVATGGALARLATEQGVVGLLSVYGVLASLVAAFFYRENRQLNAAQREQYEQLRKEDQRKAELLERLVESKEGEAKALRERRGEGA